MAAVKYKVYYNVELGDANGDVAVMRVPSVVLNDADPISAYITTLAAISTSLGAPGTITNAKVIRRGFTVLLDEAQLSSGTLPIDAEFPSVADKALLAFSNSQGSRLQVSVPAPIEAVFHSVPADDTVDPGSSIAAFITEIKAAANDIGGNALNLYQSGVRRKSRARRRKQHKL